MPYTFVVVNAKAIGDSKLRHSYLPLAYSLQTSACESLSRRANDVERYAGVTSIDVENRLEFCSARVQWLSSKVPVTKVASQVLLRISGDTLLNPGPIDRRRQFPMKEDMSWEAVVADSGPS